MVQSSANDYLIDRQAQREMKSFTGIPGIRQQDMAVTESMGPVFDRESEHLGTTDALIIRTRRRMIAAARALDEQGVVLGALRQVTGEMSRSRVILPHAAYAPPAPVVGADCVADRRAQPAINAGDEVLGHGN